MRGNAAFLQTDDIFALKKRCWPLGQLSAGEGGVHAVVVARGQWIKLVIVTLETAHGRAEECLANGVDNVIEINLSGLRGECHRRIPRAHAKERDSHEQLWVAIPLRLLFPQFIPCNLLDNKLAVRLVVIKGAYNVVAIAPGVGTFVVV